MSATRNATFGFGPDEQVGTETSLQLRPESGDRRRQPYSPMTQSSAREGTEAHLSQSARKAA